MVYILYLDTGNLQRKLIVFPYGVDLVSNYTKSTFSLCLAYPQRDPQTVQS